jgi:hypothetical protein
MKHVQDHIADKQSQFAEHQFFKSMGRCESVPQFLEIVSDLSFWVMSFQDILRLNEERVKDPYLRRLAKHHRIEDRGHELWFLEDVSSLHQETKCDIRNLFHQKKTSIRDASYAIISEVFNTDDERLRIILLFTLESTGHIFFEKAAQFVQDNGYTDRLKYFSNHHLEVEKAHAIFEDAMEKEFLSMLLSAEKRSAALALIDRVYAAFTQMFDSLLEQHQQMYKETL